MVAASPERHDGGLQANPVEVQSYQPPWKVLSDFALQSDIDQPAFQQLVSVSSPRGASKGPNLHQQGGSGVTGRNERSQGWGGGAGASQGPGLGRDEGGVGKRRSRLARKTNLP